MDDNHETQLTDLEEMPTPAKKSRGWLWVILGVALVLVLGTAAFLGGAICKLGPRLLQGARISYPLRNCPQQNLILPASSFAARITAFSPGPAI